MTDTVVAGCSTVAWDSPTSTVRTCVAVVEALATQDRQWADANVRAWSDANERQWVS